MIQKLGKYKIVDKIGEGAMGSVYKGYDSILDRNVAIKIMAEDIKWNPELKLRFYREARAAASLHHPNIVTVYDLGEEGKTTFIVMECLQGKNLKEIIQDKISIPLERKLSFIAQVADGLNHAHQGGFIHRDIKPGNIFITSTGTAKILDFGIAHIPASNLTRVGDRLGTPIYMSPELVRGAKYDARSDIFSAGIVFYEFLTYIHPFRDPKFDRTLNNILYLEKLPFAEHFPEAPSGLWPILNSCLAKEPDKRYASMAEAAAAFRGLIEELNQASQRLTKEITAILPKLRLESQRPNAPAKLTRLWAEAQDLLNREQKPDYVALIRLMAAVTEEPVFQEEATAILSAPPPAEEWPTQPKAVMPEEAPKAAPVPPPPAATITPRPAPAPPSPAATVTPRPAPPPPPAAATVTPRPAPAPKPAKESVNAVPDEQPARTLVGRIMGASDESPAIAPGAEKQPEGELQERKIVADVEAMQAEGRFDEALERIREAMGLLGPTDLLVKMLTDTRGKIEERNRAHITEFLNSAKQAMAVKEFSKAIVTLDKVLDVEPDMPEAIEMRRAALAEIEAEHVRQSRKEEGERAKAAGFKLLADKKFRESLRTFKQAAELLGEDSTIKVGIGEAEVGIKTEDLLAKVQAEFAQAQAQFQSGDLNGARSRANRVLELSPRNAEARELLAQIDRAQEEKRKSDALAALVARSRDAISRQEFDDALSLANEALEKDPSNTRIQELLQTITKAKEDARKRQEIAEILANANAALKNQAFDEAESHARAALAVIPDYPVAIECLKMIDQARARQRMGQEIDKALADAEQAFQRGDLSQCETHARRVLTMDSKESRAGELLNRVAQVRETKKREQIAVLLAQGEDALRAENFKEAANCANAIMQVEARNPAAEKLIADIRRAEAERKRIKIAECLAGSREALIQGRFETAAGFADQILMLDEKHKEAKSLLKEIAKARKKSEKELSRQQKEFAKADAANLEQDATEGAAVVAKTYLVDTAKPNRKRQYLLYGGCALVALVLTILVITWRSRSGEKAEPVAPVVQISDAKSFLDQKKYDKAIEVAQKILQTSPMDGQAKTILAEAQKQQRQTNIEVLMLEAQNYRSLGQFDESLGSVQKILDLDPGYQPALDVRTQIQEEMAASAAKLEQNETVRNSLTRAGLILAACKLPEAKSEIGAIKGEQDKDIQKRLAKARALLDACKLKDAKIIIDRAKRADPTIPEIDPFGKQLASKTAEYSRIQADLNKWTGALGIQTQIADLSGRAELLFRQAKYGECQEAVNQWLSLAPQNRQAQALSAQVNEARESIRAYESAVAAKRIPDALNALDRLEKIHPSNPDIAEYRQRAEALRRSAKATLNILRLGEAATLTLDDKSIGSDGEVVGSSVGAGSHTLLIKSGGGKQKSIHIELADGTNQTFVYNLATLDFGPMTESDRETIRIRREREKNRSFQVQHTHGLLRGSCAGELVINGFRVEYRPSQSTNHAMTHSFANLKLTRDGDKIQLAETPGNKDVGTFKARNADEAKGILEWWETLEKLGK